MVPLKALVSFFIFQLLTVPMVNAQEADTLKVKAKKGDGIYSILRNNGLEPTVHLKQFISLNKKLLRDGSRLFVGQSYILPFKRKDSVLNRTTDSIPLPTVDTVPKLAIDTVPKISAKPVLSYPIFGEAHSDIIIENNKLRGAVYYLVSGHGGPDPGATVKLDGHLLCEDEYAYDVTLRLARKLISQGAEVYIIIRDKNDGIRNKRILKADWDEVNYPDLEISDDQLTRLRQRTKTVNDLYTKNKGKYQRLVAVHVDSRSKSTDIDVFFYYHKKSKKGKRLAQNIQNTFNKKYAIHQPNRTYFGTVTSRTLYLVKKTWPAMAYIELGNIKSTKDQRRLLDPENRAALAKWIAEGMLLDYSRNKDK